MEPGCGAERCVLCSSWDLLEFPGVPVPLNTECVAGTIWVTVLSLNELLLLCLAVLPPTGENKKEEC